MSGNRIGTMAGVVVWAVGGCWPHPAKKLGIAETYTKVGLPSHTRYVIEELKITGYTLGGIAMADPLGKLGDGAAIDKAFDEVEVCLQDKMPAKWSVGETAAPIGNCSLAKVPKSIDRRALLIHAPRDVRVSRCTGRSGFPCYGADINAGVAIKKARGEIPNTPECQNAQPLCARDVQWGFVIVVTPDLSQLKVGIASAVTGCANPWAIQLVACI